MYLEWVLPCIIILLLIYLIYWMTRDRNSRKPFSEPFAISRPPQEYTIPELRGVKGRYVRIRPSLLDTADGYLSISQIQVIDVAGANVALNAKVTATSTGGSPIDQQYGRAIDYGGVYEYGPGVSADPSVVTDGVLVPRVGLTSIFETSVQNTVANDTQYLEIDLSGEMIISKVIYTGRADPMNTTYTTYYGEETVNQVTRLVDMRLEILDSNKNLVYGGPVNPIKFSDNTPGHVTEIPINMAGFIVNKGGGSAGTPPPIEIPNVASYKAISTLFTKTGDPPNANINLIRAVNTVYNSVATPYSSTSLQYTFDISGGLFQLASSDNPIGFYDYMYSIAGCPALTSETYCEKANVNTPTAEIPQTVKTYSNQGQPKYDASKYNIKIPSLTPTITITIFGTNSPALDTARTEMTKSIELCKSIYLGSPQYIENYIAIDYPSGILTNIDGMKAYIRNTDSNYWCMPDVVQIFTNGRFVTQVATLNQDWNKGRGTSAGKAKCTRELTPLLPFLPYATRNFIIEWIRSRTIRYITYYNSIYPINKLSLDVPRIVLPSLGIELTSATLLDSIAQQFYELLGGEYSMSYIYDLLPLGTTMLDVRFNLIIHVDSNTTYGPIADLKAQYTGFMASGSTLPQNIVDKANEDYQVKLSNLEQQGISNSTKPFQGAVARLFYTKDTAGVVTITGMIFDAQAVTSFIKELNCGLTVPLGPMDGNINYTPKINYTMNQPYTPLDCRNPSALRNIMDDYTAMVQSDKKILLAATPALDTSKGMLFVKGITASKQVSPTQCAIDWTENVYDIVTNNTIGTDISRRGIFTYYVNKQDWFAQNLVFAEAAGFKLYTGAIPDCVFNPIVYRDSLGNRLAGATTSMINKDFLNNTFKNGAGPICQGVIPMYTITDPTMISAVKAALTNDTTQPVVKTGASVTPEPLAKPITYTKPLPTEAVLDTASNVCPSASCADLDVLYGLAYQYNTNPSFAGMILNIQRSYTAGPNQCDIEAQVNYDAMITDILPAPTQVMDPETAKMVDYYPQIKKGTVTYSQPTSGPMKGKTVEGSKPMTMSGIQTVTIALYVDIDKSDCSYILADASGENSGFTIQKNTPFLYKPMNYAMELQARSAKSMGSSITQIQSDFNSAGGSIKQALKNYRMNTYSAIGSINTLACNKTCSSMAPNILINYVNSTGTYYKTNNITAMNVLNVATFNSNTCDLTFSDNSTPPKTYGARITLDSACNQGTSLFPINPTPTYADIQNLAQPLTTAISGFTDFVAPPTDDAYPLKTRGFGLDRARNTESIKEMQFIPPLKQEIPTKEEGNTTKSHKFIRFVPLKTRDPNAYSVAVGRLTFFYEGRPLALEGRATNPMGTWEGDIAAVTGPRATGWIDLHKKPLVFAFKTPIMTDAYSLTTDVGLVSSDPVAWKLEGSSNGTFWTLLDSRPRFSTPIGRGKETEMIYIG